jgi:hypothetical protein
VTYASGVTIAVTIPIPVQVSKELVTIASRGVCNRASGQARNNSLDRVEEIGVRVALLEDVLERWESD